MSLPKVSASILCDNLKMGARSNELRWSKKAGGWKESCKCSTWRPTKKQKGLSRNWELALVHSVGISSQRQLDLNVISTEVLLSARLVCWWVIANLILRELIRKSDLVTLSPLWSVMAPLKWSKIKRDVQWCMIWKRGSKTRIGW